MVYYSLDEADCFQFEIFYKFLQRYDDIETVIN